MSLCGICEGYARDIVIDQSDCSDHYLSKISLLDKCVHSRGDNTTIS